jgi:hypothetical protein
MPNVSYTVTGTGTSSVYNTDFFQAPFNVGLGATISATATYTVQFTFDDVTADGYVPANGTWFTEATFGTASTSKAISFTIPCRGIRLNVSASTGSVTLQVQQAGER